MLVNGHHVWDPVQEVAHSGVDTVLVFVGATLAPAHHTRQEPGLLVTCYQWPTAVAFAGVLATTPQPCAKHVLGDVELSVEAALLHGHPGQLQPLKDGSWWAELWQTSPTRNSGMTDGRQGSAECAVACRKANGNHIQPQLDRAMKLQQGQVFVRAGLVVSRVEQHFHHSPLLFCLLNPIAIVLTFIARAHMVYVRVLKWELQWLQQHGHSTKADKLYVTVFYQQWCWRRKMVSSKRSELQSESTCPKWWLLHTYIRSYSLTSPERKSNIFTMYHLVQSSQ